MAHWVGQLYGPRNLYRECRSCREEVNVEELEANQGVCRECLRKRLKADENKIINSDEKKG